MNRYESATTGSADSITVVSGIPRSGTSMMMQMLEAGGLPILRDTGRKPDSANPKGYYELASVKATARDPSWVANAPGHAVKVIHALVRELPRDRTYRVILMVRDLREVIASQARMLAARGHSPADLPEVRLAQILAAQLDETRQILDKEACFAWMEVQHHELIQDSRRIASEVSRFLGLSRQPKSPNGTRTNSRTDAVPLEPVEAMCAIVDEDLYRVRRRS
jgi:hypothetical protein